jgi:hypothetical protein
MTIRASILLLLLTTAAAGTAFARVQFSQNVVGELDGEEFRVTCPMGENLVGLDLYTRDDIDAIRPICASAYGPAELGPLNVVGEPVGGRAQGANTTRLLCAGATPVVIGAYIKAEIHKTSGVNNVHLYCGVAGENSEMPAEPLARFDGPKFGGVGGMFKSFGAPDDEATQRCQKNFVAMGIRVMASGWVHGLALICGEPGFTARKVGRTKPIDRVGKTALGRRPGIGATDYCERYSTTAVAAEIENRNLACGGTGGRWTTDYQAHFDWCLGQNGERSTPDAETAARAETLESCRAAKE